MIPDDPIASSDIDSLTIRHLRELRAEQDRFYDLLKRQFEKTDRMARDAGDLRLQLEKALNEIRSDILLLENRSLTALENDAYFRRRMEETGEILQKVNASLEKMNTQLQSVTDTFGAPPFKKD